jgi:protein-arginine kinase activator protein McsA
MAEEKKCCICNKEIATIKLLQSKENIKKEVWLCEICYNIIQEKANKSVEKDGFWKNFIPLENPEKNNARPIQLKKRQEMALSKLHIPSPSLLLPTDNLVGICRFCGITLEDFLYQKIPGCVLCFVDFKDDIKEFLNSIPSKEVSDEELGIELSTEDIIFNLQKDEKEAVSKHKFLDAAKIRDKISQIVEDSKNE